MADTTTPCDSGAAVAEVPEQDLLPQDDLSLDDIEAYGHMPTPSFWPSFFSAIVARLQWNALTIDLAADARAWPTLEATRRERLTSLLAGFCVAEDAVAEQLQPFGGAASRTAMASDQSLMTWVFFLQRRDEQRHQQLFDRIGAEVLGLSGDTPAARRDAARELAPAGVLDLFESQLPALAGELAEGRADLAAGVSLYHMILEGIVLSSGQRALLEDLRDGVMPGTREGVEHVELDERWHVGFGLRCLIETHPAPEQLDELLARACEASHAWGDAVPPAITDHVVKLCTRRLSVARKSERPKTFTKAAYERWWARTRAGAAA